jgi:hypothetical protein
MGNGWTPKRRATQSWRMRERWADPDFHERRSENIRAAIMADEAYRAKKSGIMKELNGRLRDDEQLDRKRISGLQASWTPPRRAAEAAVMADRHARDPGLRRAGKFALLKFHRIGGKTGKRRRVGRPQRREAASPFESV